MQTVTRERHVSVETSQSRETTASPTQASSSRRRVAVWACYALAVAFIIAQQIVHTPWGLPGHRAIFWLSTLIAIRLTTRDSFAATGTGAAAAAGVIAISPAFGLHCVAYIVCGFLIDVLVDRKVVRRHLAILVAVAPLLACTNVLVAFVRNASVSGVDAAWATLWFFVQGHLLWGLAAGFIGVGAGLGGRRMLERIQQLA